MAAFATALFSGIGTAVTTVAKGVGTLIGGAGTAGSAASTIGSILSGTATLLSVGAMKQATETDAMNLELQAQDAEREKPLETLQGIDRRTSIKKAMMAELGDQGTAYAASGVDLTFGSPAQARAEAFRDADLELETAVGTEQTRIARLDERASNLRTKASQVRRAGKTERSAAILSGVGSLLRRG